MQSNTATLKMIFPISRLVFLFFLQLTTLGLGLHSVCAQDKKQKEVPFSQLFKEMFVGTKEVEYKNVKFINDLASATDDSLPLDIRPYLRTKLRIKEINGYFKTTAEGIGFENCTFDDDLKFVKIKFETNLLFSDCQFMSTKRSGIIEGGKVTTYATFIGGASLPLDSCIFTSQFNITTSETSGQWFSIENCTFPDFYLNVQGNANIFVVGCTISLTELDVSKKTWVRFQKCVFDFEQKSRFTLYAPRRELMVTAGDGSLLSFDTCTMNGPKDFLLTIQANSGTVNIVNSKIDLELLIDSDEKLFLSAWNNKIDRMSKPRINALSNLSGLAPNGINHFYFSPFDSVSFAQNIENQPIRKEIEFDKGIASLKVFYDHYRETGQTELANLVYTRIRDIEKLKLAQRFRTNPSFNNFFSYQLSRLLKFYTNYGTDPARALVISFYIILLFGGFYFFFPSDWDIASKSRLILNFKTFAQKNEHGYFKPFLILIYGLFISLLNAITLSLNSFTTLGFGNIPTTGLARYVCVLQGFIGWFLLSLFTVALINQAQF